VIERRGTQTTARILSDDEELVESNVLEQLEALVDHPAFTEPIRMMPDAHVGASAPVGFTMGLGERIVPEIVGVDVGCGMAAFELGDRLPLDGHERERAVRDAVPMGRSVHDYDDAPHLLEEFPFDRANTVFERFEAAYESRFGDRIDPLGFRFDGYDGAYFKSLCERVLSEQRQGLGHVIKSAGTLGGGNHFIEFARSRETGRYWLVVHSGSRYLGQAVAEFWQQRAREYRSADEIRTTITDGDAAYLKFDPETVSDGELHTWVTGGMGESHLRKAKIREEFEGSEIEATFDRLGDLQVRADRNEELDYLEGREAHGYYVDMLFAQQYARWNRQLIGEAICDALGISPRDSFQSIHNYVDFRDLTVRKGATPAREGQRIVVPLNMAAGSLLARGKGNDEYNRSAPHGAGRQMSRSEAFETVEIEEFEAAMDGVYSESIVDGVRDEAPMAYKSSEAIAAAIEPTATVFDRLDAVHNIKSVD
jgi:RNA-splicing ligase RtcB